MALQRPISSIQFNSQSSDMDFLVILKDMSPIEHSRAYFGLLAELEALFNHHMALVEIKANNNPYFLKTMEETRTLLYVA